MPVSVCVLLVAIPVHGAGAVGGGSGGGSGGGACRVVAM